MVESYITIAMGLRDEHSPINILDACLLRDIIEILEYSLCRCDIEADGTLIWYRCGDIHNNGDRPAIICADGTRKWYHYGKLHRNHDQPAIVRADGSREWFRNGKRHRDDGLPAVIDDCRGIYEWYQNGNRYHHGKHHRDTDQSAGIGVDCTPADNINVVSLSSLP